MSEITLAPNEILFRENSLIENLYIVSKGEIETFTSIRDTNYVVKNLGKGSVLGYESFFGNLS